MTITYQHDVSSGSLRGFTRLLGKWRGSVYKLIYKELAIYCFGYCVISVVYRIVLLDDQRGVFEKVAIYCGNYIDLIPLSFVLGFYVTFVVQRWWTQFINIPWPDRLMNTVILYVDGSDERGRLMRHTLMRYWNLSFVLMMVTVSTAVKKRFPTMEHIVRAGFMTEEELQIYQSVDIGVAKTWFPMNWFINILNEARREGRTKSGASLKHVLEELNDLRNKLRLLWCHDWVTLPLVYTQVVTWATHLFFMISLIGRQYLDPSKGYKGHEVDLFVPFFTIMQFLFYMGWLKVAEQLINPFGDDDDDIECNWLVDRHLQVSYLGVDDLLMKVPAIPDHFNCINKDKDLEDIHKGNHGHNYDGSSEMHAMKSRKKISGRNIFKRNKEQTYCAKTLGSREYLFSEETLASLNMGKHPFGMGMPGSYSEGVIISNDCVIHIENNEDSISEGFCDSTRNSRRKILLHGNPAFVKRSFERPPALPQRDLTRGQESATLEDHVEAMEQNLYRSKSSPILQSHIKIPTPSNSATSSLSRI